MTNLIHFAAIDLMATRNHLRCGTSGYEGGWDEAIAEAVTACGAENLVLILTQQLATAIRSPQMTLAQWITLEAESTVDGLLNDLTSDDDPAVGMPPLDPEILRNLT